MKNTARSSCLAQPAIVLVEPKNPGNIGSVARAMKNMGLSDLRLVNPVEFREREEQKKMGYRSQEIITAAREFTTLPAALADCSLVLLTTSKRGKWRRDYLDPRAAAGMIAELGPGEKAAIVFGREDKGVTIGESQSANYCVSIPAAVAYPSLNLSQAVMVMVYEVYLAQSGRKEISGVARQPQAASREAFGRIGDNIWRLMNELQLGEPENGLFHRSLQRALNRTRWTNADIAVFDRVCKQVRWYIKERADKEDDIS